MMRLSTLCLLPVVSATAGSFTASAMAGYGLPLPGSNLATDYTTTSRGTGSSTKYETVNGSFADGFRAGVGLGYQVSPLARLELGVRYEASSEVESKNNQTSDTETDRYEGKRSVSQVAFVPSVVVAFSNEGIRPYAKVSGHFGFPTMTSETSRETSDTDMPSSNGKSETTWEYTGGIAWGFGGGIGIEFPLSEALSVTGEVVADNWSWAPAEGEKTKHNVNGRNVLPEESKSETKVKFVDSYTYSSTTNIDEDQPSKSLSVVRTYSALALNLGLQMRF